jgi:hypothetical protein
MGFFRCSPRAINCPWTRGVAHPIRETIQEKRMTQKLIICGGLSRSGSTWQYNVVRMLASAAYGQTYGAWILNYDPDRPEAVHVVKAHNPQDVESLRYDAVVTSYRDLRDALVSVRRMGWYPYERPKQIKNFSDRYVANLAAWEKIAARVTRYEEMMADPLAEIHRIAAALKLTLSDSELKNVHESVQAMRPPQEEPTGMVADADPETQLHPGHISNEIVRLDDKTRQFIERHYGTWLCERGYIIDSSTSLAE